MARIRTVKPELFSHEALFDAERETGLPLRLAFIGLFTCCDREGRFKWRPRPLKLDVLPYDEVDFERVLDALFTRGFIVKYAFDTEIYGAIPSWNKHQVINNRESQSEIPEPTESSLFSIPCARDSRVDDASSTRLVHAQGEGKGRERKGREKEGNGYMSEQSPDVCMNGHDSMVQEGKQIVVERRAEKDDVVETIFAYWQKTMNSQRSQLDDKRKKAIKGALKLYEPREICEAILGCSKSDFHMARGEHLGKQKYNGICLILRDAEHIDKFIELAGKRQQGPETLEQRNARIIGELMAEDGASMDSDIIDVDMEEMDDAQ